MAYDVTLTLREDLLKDDAIILEAKGYDETPLKDFDTLEREMDLSGIIIFVHRNTGEVLSIKIEDFRQEIKLAIKMLRDNPLPWTFSVPAMKIKEKPLEDVLLAIYKKHKGIKMEWE